MSDVRRFIGLALCVTIVAAIARIEGADADDTIQAGQSNAQKAMSNFFGTAAGGPFAPLVAGSNGNVAAQQLTTQSDIQVNTTAVASAAESARGVRCLAAQRSGVEQAGCLDLLQGATTKTTGFNEPFGISFAGRFGNGKLDTVSGQTGFDSDVQNFTLNLDYRFSNQLVGGISVGYQHSKLDFDLDSGNLKSDAYRIAPFITYAIGDKGYIDAMLGYGWLHYDSTRICSACNTGATGGVVPVNTGSYNGSEYLASIGGGYDFGSAPWAVRGYVRGDYVRVSPDAYTEGSNVPQAPGNVNPALHVDSQTATSLTSVLGIEVGRVFGMSWAVLVPRLRAEWVHEFKDDQRTLNSSFVAASSSVISFQTNSPVRDWANVGAALQMNFAHSLSAFLDYEHLFKQDASNDVFSIGVRYEF